MLRAEEVVVETVGLLAREREHLLRARGKIAHGFIAHTGIIMLRIGQFVQCVWEIKTRVEENEFRLDREFSWVQSKNCESNHFVLLNAFPVCTRIGSANEQPIGSIRRTIHAPFKD